MGGHCDANCLSVMVSEVVKPRSEGRKGLSNPTELPSNLQLNWSPNHIPANGFSTASSPAPGSYLGVGAGTESGAREILEPLL